VPSSGWRGPASSRIRDRRHPRLEARNRQPFGHGLLVLVAVALAGYALWRLFRAALGHGPEGSDSTLDRIAAFGSGIAYAGLCALAVEILLSSRSDSSTLHKTAAGLFGWTAGTWLVGAAGILLIGVGIYQAYRGVSRDFLEDSKTAEMDPAVQTWLESIASVGHVARAVVFSLDGVFLVRPPRSRDLPPREFRRREDAAFRLSLF